MTDRDAQWARLMQAANRGDASAYRRVLEGLTPLLRDFCRQGFARCGLGGEDVEDVVQETLLAVHLKRQTWDESQPLLPWVRAIAKNKLVDNLRRRGRRLHVPIEDFTQSLFIDEEPAKIDVLETRRILTHLDARQRDIVTAMSIEGASAREVAARLGMTEGAVRVVLHRALKSLSAAFRNGRS